LNKKLRVPLTSKAKLFHMDREMPSGFGLISSSTFAFVDQEQKHFVCGFCPTFGILSIVTSHPEKKLTNKFALSCGLHAA
jgi:hypothetical protein